MPRHRTGKIPWSRPLADLVPTAIGPVLSRRGFADGGLVLFWEDIAGERLAAASQPLRVQWPVRPAGRAAGLDPSPATLVVRVETGFALELQHLAPVVVERINTHFGWRCIGRLKLQQGPVAVRPVRKPVPLPLDAAAAIAAERLIGSGVDESLRQALARLGGRVLAAPR